MRDDQLVGDYGVDAPRTVRGVGYLSGGLLVLAVVCAIVAAVPLMVLAFLASSLAAFVALLLVRSSRVGKLRERVRLVDRLGLAGDEIVLDVGCGPGVLLVEAAHQLPDGLAVGIDIWRAQNMSDNDSHTTQDNAELEGVDDLIEVQVADARRMPFGAESFDAVVSRMALHNIGGAEGRVLAIREIDRVLKPGGQVILVDFARTKEYVHALRACNWTVVRRSKPTWRLVPPLRYVEGTKPVPGAPRAVEPVDAAKEAPADSQEPADDIAEELPEPEESAAVVTDEPVESDEGSDEPKPPGEKPEVPVV